MSRQALEWTTAMIPPCYSFLPTDSEIIKFYLVPWSKGLPFPVQDFILEVDVYGPQSDPQSVFPGVEDGRWDTVSEKIVANGDFKEVKRVMYVVTTLCKINDAKTRIARRAGPGTWSGQTCPRKIYDGTGRLIGMMRMFSYEMERRQKRDGKDRWIMHEYSLAGDDDVRHKDKEYVICKITRISKEPTTSRRELLNRSCGQLLDNDQILPQGFDTPCALPFDVDDGVDVEQLLNSIGFDSGDDAETDGSRRHKKPKLSCDALNNDDQNGGKHLENLPEYGLCSSMG